MNFLKKILLVFKHPGVLVRYRSIRIRKLFFIISKYLHVFTFFSRRRPINYKSDLYINGYEKIEIDTLMKNDINVNLIIEDVQKKIKNFDFSNKTNHIKSIAIPDLFDTNSRVFSFLTSNYLINRVSSYLGCIPLLIYSSVWFSDNQEKFEGSSQEYHLDHEDYRQVKGFLYLENIDENNGAMSLFSPDISKKIIKKLNYNTSPNKKRVSDDIFSKYESEKIICNGKKGTLYLVDTSKGFHCGARKSLKSRLLLTFQFISPWANYLEWNWKKSEVIKRNKWKIKNLNTLQKKIIGIIQ